MLNNIRFTRDVELHLQLRISFRISKYFELRKCFFLFFSLLLELIYAPFRALKTVVKSRSVKRNAKTTPFPKSHASYFRFARIITSPLYYLRAWDGLTYLRLVKFKHNSVCLFCFANALVLYNFELAWNGSFDYIYATRVHYYGLSRQVISVPEAGFLLNPTVSPRNRKLGPLVIAKNFH